MAGGESILCYLFLWLHEMWQFVQQSWDREPRSSRESSSWNKIWKLRARKYNLKQIQNIGRKTFSSRSIKESIQLSKHMKSSKRKKKLDRVWANMADDTGIRRPLSAFSFLLSCNRWHSPSSPVPHLSVFSCDGHFYDRILGRDGHSDKNIRSRHSAK